MKQRRHSRWSRVLCWVSGHYWINGDVVFCMHCNAWYEKLLTGGSTPEPESAPSSKGDLGVSGG